MGKVFIKSVLRPNLCRDVPRLFGKDASKAVLHIDSEASHTCQKTVQWLNENRIKYITKGQWMPNLPKEFPMDYFANEYSKKPTYSEAV